MERNLDSDDILRMFYASFKIPAGIFDRLPADCLGCSIEQRKETYNMAAKILTKSGHLDQAAVYSNKM